MSIADFHSHTNHSDGVLSPSKLINLAINNQVAYLAITDHDTIDGIKEARNISKNNDNITIITGIELSVDLLGEDVHILGIGIDEYNEGLIGELKKLKEARDSRAKEIIHMLSKKEIHLEMPKIKKKAGKATIGRPHIAQEMISKKYVSSIQEAFDSFLSKPYITKIKRHKLSSKKAIEMIQQAGGLSFLAHPTYLKQLNKIIEILSKDGLFGIEAYYKNYDTKTIKQMLEIANKYNLYPIGGSDYHGIHGNKEKLPGKIPLPDKIAIELIEKHLKI
ncbi:MAG: phosphoesterase [Chloroflexi bacterium]|nr:phosphoesterase [Chloroflexota bacterium]|tara:strand:- start:8951 stop:9781 length:831 start_codon:yes stop_codon:yes gene_type:complete